MTTTWWEALFDPAQLFDDVVYGAETDDRYDVVGRPGERVGAAAQPGDLVVRRAFGEGNLASVVPLDDDLARLLETATVPRDRLLLRPRWAGAPETEDVASPDTCRPGEGPAGPEPGPRPLLKRGTSRQYSRRPSVGYAQRCLGTWMTGHATEVHDCRNRAYVEQALRRLQANGQFPLVPDCRFGPNTDLGTRAFQACRGISRDGAIGKVTWPLLELFAPGRPTPVTPGRIVEIDIDATFGLFATYFHPVLGQPARNVFSAADRAALAGNTELPELLVMLTALVTGGVVGTDATGDNLVSLRALLVLPATVPETGTPLALLVHGNAPVYEPDVPSAANEMHSYRGYGYLQRDLAARGIGSLSVSVNVVNGFNSPSPRTDEHRRAEVLAIHLALLVALATGTVPAASPLRVQLPGRGMVPLRDALPEIAGAAEGTALAKLRDLATAVRAARPDFGRLGVLGHSRGAWSALNFAECVAAAAGAPGALPPNLSSSRDEENAVARVTMQILRDAGRPTPDGVKAVVAFQAEELVGTPLALPDLFLLAVAGTHDEDVASDAVNIYEVPTCPKAMVLIHGATHGRFNTVWRALPDVNKNINRNVRCQEPIRLLSNASHEQLAIAFVGACFEARLRDQPAMLGFFTGERRAPVRADVTRTWLFPVPVNRPGGLVPLDSRCQVANPAGAPPVPATKVTFVAVSPMPHLQRVDTFRVSRPATQRAEMLIDITTADALATRTHVSVRMAKEHNARSAATRTSEPMRNFELALLDSAGVVVGRAIPGTAVPSTLHRAYPTRLFLSEADACMDVTEVALQTVEVPVDQFVRGTSRTVADLALVRQLVFRMLPAPGKRGDDVFRLADFTLSTRR